MDLSIDDKNHSLTWFEYVAGFGKVGHILLDNLDYVTSNDGYYYDYVYSCLASK